MTNIVSHLIAKCADMAGEIEAVQMRVRRMLIVGGAGVFLRHADLSEAQGAGCRW